MQARDLNITGRGGDLVRWTYLTPADTFLDGVSDCVCMRVPAKKQADG